MVLGGRGSDKKILLEVALSLSQWHVDVFDKPTAFELLIEETFHVIFKNHLPGSRLSVHRVFIFHVLNGASGVDCTYLGTPGNKLVVGNAHWFPTFWLVM